MIRFVILATIIICSIILASVVRVDSESYANVAPTSIPRKALCDCCKCRMINCDLCQSNTMRCCDGAFKYTRYTF